MVAKALGGAARAGAWSAIDIVLRQSVQFIVSVVLARLLSPADFGIIALVSFFTGFGTAVVEGGFATALIQRQETTREQESALFWMGIVWSAGLGLLLVLLAPRRTRTRGGDAAPHRGGGSPAGRPTVEEVRA